MKGNNMTRFFGRMSLKAKKHSPEIFLGLGIGGVVTGFVTAIISTTKLEKVKEKNKERIEEVENYVEENGFSEEYSEQDYKKDITIVTVKNGLEYAKLYAPSIIFEGIGVFSILMSHGIIKKRYKGISAAYASTSAALIAYRERVRKQLGEDDEKKLYFGITKAEVSGKDENGNEYIEVKEVSNKPPQLIFSRWTSKLWCPDAINTNLTTLSMIQSYCTDNLICKGHFFINELLDELQMNRLVEGQDLGWVYDDEHDGVGDNYIDLRPMVITAKNEFGEWEECIALDPNYDGNIHDLI